MSDPLLAYSHAHLHSLRSQLIDTINDVIKAELKLEGREEHGTLDNMLACVKAGVGRSIIEQIMRYDDGKSVTLVSQLFDRRLVEAFRSYTAPEPLVLKRVEYDSYDTQMRKVEEGPAQEL